MSLKKFFCALGISIVLLSAVLFPHSGQKASASMLYACDNTSFTPTDMIGNIFQIDKVECAYGLVPVDDSRLSPPRYENSTGVTVFRARSGYIYPENQPVVIFVHGGGWVDGYRNQYRDIARSLTGSKGWMTVVIDYRLTANEVKLADTSTKAADFPTNLEDVASALTWVGVNISSWGGDPTRIFVLGHGAGAQLATTAVLRDDLYSEDYRPRPNIKGLITLSGLFDLGQADIQAAYASQINQTFTGGTASIPANASAVNLLLPGMQIPRLLLITQTGSSAVINQANRFKAVLSGDNLEFASRTLDASSGYDDYNNVTDLYNVNSQVSQYVIQFIEDRLRELSPHVYMPVVSK
jgi:pimeloyl-ACP methyl ester carboxylesterase